MKVTPVSKTLNEVLRGSFLRVPRFQRPYDWDRENLLEFWNDLKDRSDPEYFMGSLVVFSDQKEKNLLSLVDGQQRITTITIMLAIIRNYLEELGESGPASAIHDLIESRDLDNKSRFVLEHDPPDRFFQYVVQSRSPDQKTTPEGTQQENLDSARRYLEGVLRAHLKSGLGSDKAKAIAYLKHLRDCLLQMHFISIELDNEDDAYLIFETLNTRGKDLRPSDLLKNHFMRLLPAKTKNLDVAKNLWTDTTEKLHSVQMAIDFDSFLLHYWLSHQTSVSKANLFLSYKAAINKKNAKSWLESIRSAASTYVRCMAPMEVKWTKEERALRDALHAIRIFGVAQAAPLMLALMTQYENKIISLKTTRSAFELIERFTFQFNALTQSRGGGGVSNMYAKLAQNTMDCDDAQDFTAVLQDMRSKFRERTPDETEFSLPFMRLIFRSSYTRERNLVRYVLTKLARHFGMPEEVDQSLLTIEHIQPQSKGEETGDEFDVGAIGNLILINESLNGKVDDKPFKEKMKHFKAANNVYMDDYLKNATDWNYQSIADRGLALAKIGYDKIWKI
ncbi:DUF262 domain-containing protein [Sinorhizobium sp. 22678]|uniref:DUF262 domain-containing protein n=1 Tax=Sinorhizobium sp. 22678 TaxID=3453955 RepID=UPI003F830FF5